MMNFPLTLRSFLERAEKVFPKKEIVSRTSAGIFRYNYAEYGNRTRRLASVLESLGVERGERVGTFAWNHHRHLEVYFAVPCMGAVLHTINIRLSGEHIAYIVNHAEDKVLFVDEDLLPAIEKVKDQLKTVKAFVVMTDKPELPPTTLSPVYSYEQLLAQGNPNFQFPQDLDENAPAGMCYTSATTGNPKGVVYTHRSTYLHTMCLGLADTLGLSEADCLMPVVPMFHVNAWGMPFAAVCFGSKQVLPGPMPTPNVLLELIQQERVTLTAGVPTVWLGVMKAIEEGNYDLSSIRAIVCGGSAAPRSLIHTYEKKYGIPFLHAYGMTEASPVVTVSRLKSYQKGLSDDEMLDIRSKQGLLVPGLEMRVVGQTGEDVNWNGQEMGELLLRGPWIADEYYRDERSRDTFVDGWYHSGDVAVVDEEGTIKLVDRTKDLVKSGGEWISSVDLENALMAHPAVFEASVVGVPHPKWDERPIAFVVLKEGFKGKVAKEEFFTYLQERFAKWWVPDDVIFLDEIPKTSVGKFLKRALRSQFQDHFAS
ncbi:long-chain fatty acid--CoA ligase [Effusibacillus lacus]|uniref:Fatty-acid--CoA ligase n=1 Tax=Effusibacillus lacus TaxID=1348429 RepID=A0A292YGH6_9BACL|nr:long-chain fatty acid--CoA ligase [Effusibacillus lacus]TCS74574.1 fatty-acyl-CoA synthase [Effusibacillus lacus]GAX88448.1 fatty-acid--CoA ligase [Effusibacillus lacus]